MFRWWFLRKYKLKRYLKEQWFAFPRDRKYPPYFTKGKYNDWKIGDLVPMILLPDGKIAFYIITDIHHNRYGNDLAPWDDGRHYDLRFSKVGN